ncbi:MAG: hypothetical protein EXX96DRAFT_448311, partial [Benjaminiella poitrasii]
KKIRKRPLKRCANCQTLFRPHIWGHESGKGPICDTCYCHLPSKDIMQQRTHQHSIIECANCQATTTPLWRRDALTGEIICNACGFYYKLHHEHRPAAMMRTVIKRRKKRCGHHSSDKSPDKGSRVTDATTSGQVDHNETTSSNQYLSLPSIINESTTEQHDSSSSTATVHQEPPLSLDLQRQELQNEIYQLTTLLSNAVRKLSAINDDI